MKKQKLIMRVLSVFLAVALLSGVIQVSAILQEPESQSKSELALQESEPQRRRKSP